MNKLNLNSNSIKIDKDYIKIEEKGYTVVFTNAEYGRSFNRNTEDGLKELNSLKDEFNVQEVVYLKQIHSDFVLNYSKDSVDFNENEGDAIITNEKNVIAGVFTADCVPVILVDNNKKVCSAIHSGWKGTFESITYKALTKMKNEFNCNMEDIRVYIGPHIKKCCYEVSEDLKEKFIERKSNIDKSELFDGRNLNLEACILEDARKAGVKENNINALDLCTFCSEDIKLHSYRKANGTYGRMFTFIILN